MSYTEEKHATPLLKSVRIFGTFFDKFFLRRISLLNFISFFSSIRT